MQKKIAGTAAVFFLCALCFAQDKITSGTTPGEEFKIIPDKVFEIGIPLLFIFLLMNALISYGKHRAENQLKLKMLEKGISEEALVKIFKESNAVAKVQPLKWFLFGVATGLSVLIIYLARKFMHDSAGYLALSIIILFNAAASFIYYIVLSKRV
jgi:hypothetical protein